MYALGCCRTVRTSSQLGIPLIGTIASLIPSIGGIFGGGKDAERKVRIDDNFAKAMAGEENAAACLESMAKDGATVRGVNCAVGSKWAVGYANQKWLELRARQVAGQVGVTLIGESTIPTTVAGRARGLAMSPALWAAVGVAAVALLSRRSRR